MAERTGGEPSVKKINRRQFIQIGSLAAGSVVSSRAPQAVEIPIGQSLGNGHEGMRQLRAASAHFEESRIPIRPPPIEAELAEAGLRVVPMTLELERDNVTIFVAGLRLDFAALGLLGENRPYLKFFFVETRTGNVIGSKVFSSVDTLAGLPVDVFGLVEPELGVRYIPLLEDDRIFGGLADNDLHEYGVYLDTEGQLKDADLIVVVETGPCVIVLEDGGKMKAVPGKGYKEVEFRVPNVDRKIAEIEGMNNFPYEKNYGNPTG